MSVEASPLPLTGTAGTQVVLASPAVYRGLSVAEIGGAVATVKVYDHASAASGTLMGSYSLAAGGSVDVWFAGGGVHAAKGLTVAVVGTVEGSIRIG